ncbi:hypothetical protein [Filimonas effusa]|uniref:Lipocalin-like domain-containing protein n=1 Tax=Filimonas effusa TaxID=2508721 RepID=A0A4Q1D1Z3_9BACT|nr:hypothetical protein [Filimonas effusa]RXK81886.1 hypothetical protein ESB13_19060 [Filimonas effusa]
MKHVLAAPLAFLLLAACSKSPATPEQHSLVGTWQAIGERSHKTLAEPGGIRFYTENRNSYRTFMEQPRIFLVHTRTDTTVKMNWAPVPPAENRILSRFNIGPLDVQVYLRSGIEYSIRNDTLRTYEHDYTTASEVLTEFYFKKVPPQVVASWLKGN